MSGRVGRRVENLSADGVSSMDRKSHWENVYTTKAFDQVSWYREHLDTSLRMILGTGVQKDAAVIDVGGGSSTLVDDLLDRGFVDLTVLDLSGQALDVARKRLGSRGKDVDWIEAMGRRAVAVAGPARH